MNITLLAVGSRGDVQPVIALGVGLRRAGHRVRVGSYAQYAGLATEHGLAFTPLAGDAAALLQSEQGRAMLETRNPLRRLELIRAHLLDLIRQAQNDILAACADADLLVSVSTFFYITDAVAAVRQIPHVSAQLQPLLPTRAFASPQLPVVPARTPALNRLSHELFGQLFWLLARPVMNQIRADLGLAALPRRWPFPQAVRAGTLALYAHSRLVLPRPADWPPTARVTGFWFLDAPEQYTPPAELAAFLAAGEPPVYVGFGSMNTRDPRRTAELVLRALELSGRRGVLLRGWGGLDADTLPGHVHMVDAVPHDWLFPRLSAVVHHGGVGTTAAGLRAGVPSVLVPFFADQPFWAERVAGLGVGPAPLPRATLTAEGLARALDQTGAPGMRRRAAAVGAIVAAEDGVGRAVALVEQTLSRPTVDLLR